MAAAGSILAWVDTETDGLTAHKKHLLEVACIITDTDLNVLSVEPFHAYVKYNADEIAAMYDAGGQFVRDTHTNTGLWHALESGTPLAQVEGDLLAFIRTYCPDKDEAHLAGNSIRLDMNFIEEHLPRVGEHLHYRMVDVSTLSLLTKWATGKSVAKASDHTAVTDIQESLAELRIIWGPLREILMKNPDLIADATPARAARDARVLLGS